MHDLEFLLQVLIRTERIDVDIKSEHKQIYE